jgi:hypothetical protein
MLLDAEVEVGGCWGASRESWVWAGDEWEVGRVGMEGDSEATTKVSLALFFVRIKVHLPRSHRRYRVYDSSPPRDYAIQPPSLDSSATPLATYSKYDQRSNPSLGLTLALSTPPI